MTIPDIGINPLDYGAVGDGIANDRSAMDAAFAAMQSSAAPIFLPGGKTFKCVLSQPWVWDFTPIRTRGAKITGQGRVASTIALAPTYAGGAGVKAWQWQAASDWYYVDATDFNIQASFDGVALTLGQDSFVDPLNFFTARNVAVYNSLAASANGEAIRINYMVNSHFDNCQANCFANGAGANYGTALRVRQAGFVTHTNASYGNAARGVWFTDGQSYANLFDNADIENVLYCVDNSSPTSGGHKFILGRMSLWQWYGVTAPAGTSGTRLKFEMPSLGPLPGHTTFVDPSHPTGVVVS